MSFAGMSPGEWQAIWLTAKLAGLTTLILLLLSAPLAWWLARSRSRWVNGVTALVSLPLVLPPTVIGFYLLIVLGPQGAVGGALEQIGLQQHSGRLGDLLAALCGATAARGLQCHRPAHARCRRHLARGRAGPVFPAWCCHCRAAAS